MIIPVISLVLLQLHATFADRYSVRGQLICPSNPRAAADAQIRLYDDDNYARDTKMWEGKPNNRDGAFDISGESQDGGMFGIGQKIDVKFKIRHFCMSGTMNNAMGRAREFKFELPKEYIDKGPFDFGVLNLEVGIDAKESREIQSGSAIRNLGQKLGIGRK